MALTRETEQEAFQDEQDIEELVNRCVIRAAMFKSLTGAKTQSEPMR